MGFGDVFYSVFRVFLVAAGRRVYSMEDKSCLRWLSYKAGTGVRNANVTGIGIKNNLLG